MTDLDTSQPLRNERTIHIDIPEDVPTELADAFDEALSAFIFDENWTDVAPFMLSHSEACEHSDHCHGPGSNAERRAKAEALREAADSVTGNEKMPAIPRATLRSWLRERADEMWKP